MRLQLQLAFMKRVTTTSSLAGAVGVATALSLMGLCGVSGCGDDASAPQQFLLEGVVTDTLGDPVDGALINLVYEFVPETAARIASSVDLKSFPNPFAGVATVQFDVPDFASGSLEVFDVANNPVRTLLLATRLSGRIQAEWDGRDAGNRLVPSGLYEARLVLEGRDFEIHEEIDVFHNLVDPNAFAETWVVRTDADGAFSIPVQSLPWGESFVETDRLGASGETVVVGDLVTVWATLPGTPPRHVSTRVSMAQNVFVELSFQ